MAVRESIFGTGFGSASLKAQELALQRQQEAISSPAANRRGGMFAVALGERVAEQRRVSAENNVNKIINEEYDKLNAESTGPVDVATNRAYSHIRAAARLQAAGNHTAASEQYQIGAGLLQQRRAEQLGNQKLQAESRNIEATAANSEFDKFEHERGVMYDLETGAPLGTEMMGPGFDAKQDAYEAQHGKPVGWMSMDQYGETFPGGIAQLDGRDLMTPSQLAKFNAAQANANVLNRNGSALIRVIDEAFKTGQDPLSDVSTAEGFAKRIQTNVREIRNRWTISEAERAQAEGRSSQSSSDVSATYDRWVNKLPANVARRAVSKSLLIDMAYAFALARNDRVTDADFDMALAALGGESGSSDTAIQTLTSVIDSTNYSADASIAGYMANQQFANTAQGQVLANSAGARRAAYDQYKKDAAAWLGSRGQTQVGQGNSTAPAPAAPAPSGSSRFELVGSQ